MRPKTTGYRAAWIFVFALPSLLVCQWLPRPWQVEQLPTAPLLQLCWPDYRLQSQTRPLAPPPLISEVGTDPDQIFDQNPPSASDNAVLLSSLNDLGVRQLCLLHPMSWKEPDPFAIKALEGQAHRFEPIIIAAAVTRGSVDQDLPAAFQRSSLPLTRLNGSVAALPRVNQLALPGSFTGLERTWAGFSDIESSPTDPGRACLIAIWHHRVIFSVALLHWLASEQSLVDDLEITPGHSIFLPKKQLRLPIDEFGTIALPSAPITPATCAITALIRPQPALAQMFHEHMGATWIVPELHSHVTTQKQLLAYQQLRSLSANVRYIDWMPMPELIEVAFLAVMAWMLALLSELPTRAHLIGMVMLGIAVASWILFLPLRPFVLPLVIATTAQALYPQRWLQRLWPRGFGLATPEALATPEPTTDDHESAEARNMPSD